MNKKLLALLLVPFLLFGPADAHALEKEERLWEDETIYHIIIDRFHNGNSKNDYKKNVHDPEEYNGGDFEGLTDKLDYIKDMGFTAISLSPVFKNEDKGYHGYWVQDFYKTEEQFGTMKEFKKLVEEAHERDLKVLVEFVADQVGPNHEWLQDPAKEDWFTEGTMLNHENDEVASYLLEVAAWWIDETDIDGYTVNHVSRVPDAFWEDFNGLVKDEKEGFFVIGNDPQGNAAADTYLELGFDSIVDRDSIQPMRDAYSKFDASPAEALEKITELDADQSAVTVLDDISMSRFTRDIVDNKQNPGARWKQALVFLYTTPGIPSVLYGSEIALDGGETPDNQRLMGFKADKELIDYISLLGDLRQELPALTRGSMDVLYDKDGMLVFKRSYKSETIVVAINNTSKTQTVTFTSDQLAEDKELRGLLAGDLSREKDGEFKLVVDREESEIYALAEKTGINMGFIAAIASVWILFAIFIILVMKRSKRNAPKE